MESSTIRKKTPNAYVFLSKYAIYISFVVLMVFFSFTNKAFLTVENMFNLLQQSSASMIAAVGMVFVILTAGIDISVGSTIYLSAALAATFTNDGLGLIPTVLVSLSVGALIGAINGYFIAKLRLVPIIVTLAMMYIVRGFTLTLVEVKIIYFMNEVADLISFQRLFDYVPVIILLMILIMAIGQYTLKYSKFGRHLYAIGNNRLAAQKAGIPVVRNVFISYTLCGALAGLAGLVGSAQAGAVTTTYGQGQEFIIISAIILGGCSLFGGKGSIFPGAFLGVFITMLIENGLVMANANPYVYTIVRGMVIFLAVMLDCLKNKGELR